MNRSYTVFIFLPAFLMSACGGIDEAEPASLAECVEGEWHHDISLVNTNDGTTDYFYSMYRFNSDGTIDQTARVDANNWDDLFTDNNIPILEDIGWIGDAYELYFELLGGGDGYSYRAGLWSVNEDEGTLTMTLSTRPEESPLGYGTAEWYYNLRARYDPAPMPTKTTTQPVHCKSNKLVFAALESEHDDTIDGFWQSHLADVNVSLGQNSVQARNRVEGGAQGYALRHTNAGYEMAACFGGRSEFPERFYKQALVRLDLNGSTPEFLDTGISDVRAASERSGTLYFTDGDGSAGRYQLTDGTVENISLPARLQSADVLNYSSGIGFYLENESQTELTDLYLIRDSGEKLRIPRVITGAPAFQDQILSYADDGAVMMHDLGSRTSTPFLNSDDGQVRSLQSWVSSGDDDLFFLARNMVTGAREIWQKSSSPAAVYLGNLGVYLNDTVAEEDLFLIGDSRLLYVSEGAQEIWIYDRDSGNSQEYVVDFPVQVTSPTFVHRGPDDGSFYIRFGSHEGLWLVGRDQAVTLVQAQSYPVNGAGGMSYLAAGGRLYMLNQNGEMVPLNQYDEYQPQKAYFLNNNLYFLTGDGHVATTLPDQSIYLLDERITHPVSSVWNGAPFIPFWDARTTGNKSLVLYWPETQETLQADPLNIIGLTQRMSLFDLQDQVILMAAYSRENACDGPYDPLFFEDGKLWYESDYRPIYGQATYVK